MLRRIIFMRQAVGRVKWGNITYWPVIPHHQFLRNGSTKKKSHVESL